MKSENRSQSKQGKKSEPVELTGSEILVQALIDEGVDTIFGYPGGAVIGIYDVFYRTPKIKHILVRHEQGATHAADGYARVTGKPGVVMVTSGPGATNTVTGISNAHMDSIPIVVFTGQVPSPMIGNDAFQEADIIGITRPITKHSYLVKDVNQLARIVHEAFHIATTGRPGPVLIDLPKDILVNKTSYKKITQLDIRGYSPTYKGHAQQITKAANMINNAIRPLIYAGGGVISGNAAEELRELAIKGNIPVTTTLLGLGAFPEDSPLSLGMLGMHGTWYANMAITECDVLLAIGARFDDRITGKLETFSKKSKKIHIDIDPSCIAKNVPVNIPIVGHAKETLPQLTARIHKLENKEWLETIAQWKKEHPLKYKMSDQVILPQYVVEKIAEVSKRKAIVVTDVGQNQMWSAQFYGFRHPRTLLSSGGLGTMGYGLPAAIGASIGKPDQIVFCITGDGGFQMNIQELATAVKYKVPVKVALLNNGYLGMVRQWQELFFGARYSATVLKDGNPDFIKVVEGFGGIGIRVVDPKDVVPALKESLKIKDKPVVMEFMVAPEEKVFPMVPAGASLFEMLEE
ncbi:biosynthetic-type acetolactate synthase large subunit [bacterium]|nr:biosynthetic-type acetolactate synthase large subunit [bacterium]RQV95299.1 MAG: biosynthetic-type acetolactate synthase large subunit [bacterium]